MNTIYECSICHAYFHDVLACEKHERRHNTDTLARGLSLGCEGREYVISEKQMRIPYDGELPDSKIKCFGMYDGYPRFSVECYDNPEDVFRAKKAMLMKAIDWANAYKDKVEKMLQELKTAPNCCFCKYIERSREVALCGHPRNQSFAALDGDACEKFERKESEDE